VSLKKDRAGLVVIKETMAITMIDPVNVLQKPFEESHLLARLRKAVVCARLYEDSEELCTRLLKVATFDLGNSEIYNQVNADYDLVRQAIREEGFQALTGKMGGRRAVGKCFEGKSKQDLAGSPENARS